MAGEERPVVFYPVVALDRRHCQAAVEAGEEDCEGHSERLEVGEGRDRCEENADGAGADESSDEAAPGFVGTHSRGDTAFAEALSGDELENIAELRDHEEIEEQVAAAAFMAGDVESEKGRSMAEQKYTRH